MVDRKSSRRKRQFFFACAAVIVAGLCAWFAYLYAYFREENASLFYKQLTDADKSCIVMATSRDFLSRLKKPGERFTAEDAAMVQSAMDCLRGKFYH